MTSNNFSTAILDGVFLHAGGPCASNSVGTFVLRMVVPCRDQCCPSTLTGIRGRPNRSFRRFNETNLGQRGAKTVRIWVVGRKHTPQYPCSLLTDPRDSAPAERQRLVGACPSWFCSSLT